jgi:2-polyprenyl-6-methoxyphenol hydroxylase-like FAD-dependent oxidoreductase
MTPGRGAGANTALRDAVLLSRALTDTDRGQKELVQAIHDYEVEMIRYSSEAVDESKKQMSANDLIHRPVVGRLQLALMRGVWRLISAVPALRQLTLRKIMRIRGEN